MQVASGYLLTIDPPGLFVVLPDISDDGTLTLTSALDRSGIANISVQGRDNGWQLNGGVDLSTFQPRRG